MSQLLLKKSRHYSSVTLFVAALVLLSFLFVQRSRSANPAEGTLTPGGPPLAWVGEAPGGVSPEGETTCVEGATCETYTLTLSGNPGDWVNQKARITISAADPAVTDYDVYVHKGDSVDVQGRPNGPLVGSAGNGGTPPEVVELDPTIASVGTGIFKVHVVYWAATAADQYNGTVMSVGGAPTPTPTPTGTPTPTPEPPGQPRFTNYYAPPGVMEDAGEPTLGVNWLSENNPRAPNAVRFANTIRTTGATNPTFNGGTSLYYGGINNFFLRATFDDCASPALVQWDQIALTTANATRVFYDPIIYTDHWTGRTWVAQEVGLTPGGSTIEYTDNDGDTMLPSEGGAPSGGVDHQTIGGGPFAEPLPPGVLYPHAVYYASQNVGSATSQLSLDGGVTFPIQTAMFTASDCAGLHGHIKVAEDGTAYLPDKACSEAGVPFVFGGHPSVVVSLNNGLTWDVRPVLDADSTASVDDPSVGVSWCPPGTCSPEEKAARSNHIYLGFMYSDGRPGVAYSNDKGLTWARVVDLGAIDLGNNTFIEHVAFPAVAVGDPDRAAFAFLGTTTNGNYAEPNFPGVWHLYIATTFDSGQTWKIQNVSPEGPIQRGGVCGDGTCRNLLDFQDIQIDKQGRILVAGQDGCIGGCENGGTNSFTAKAFITRQIGGMRMFSVYDAQTAEPTLPGAPNVTALLNGGAIALSWPEPDHGGSPITSYQIFRAPTAAGPFNASTLIATVTQPGYVDENPTAPDNYYVVTATNSVGESPYCREVQAVTGGATGCDLPGILVSNDLLDDGSDNDSGANTPVDPRVNAKALYLAEPFVGAGSDELHFTLQVEPSTQGSAPPNSQWYIIWQREAPDTNHDRAYVAMKTDVFGAPTFEYGKFGVALDPMNPNQNANTPMMIGAADAGSSYDPLTGVIKIILSKSKLRAFDGGPSSYQPGADISAANVRTYFNRPDPGQRSQNNASDITPDGLAYILINTAKECAPDEIAILDAFSRKTHGEAGVFDLRIGPLPAGGSPVVEPRIGDGPNGNRHHVVLVFPQQVTFTGATATTDSGGTVSDVSVSPSSGPASEVTVSFSATDVQYLTVNLQGVSVGAGSVDVAVPMALLQGDVNGNGAVNSSDVGEAKQRSGNQIERDTFRIDVTVNGVINSSDISLIKTRSGNNLPPSAPPKEESANAKRGTR